MFITLLRTFRYCISFLGKYLIKNRAIKTVKFTIFYEYFIRNKISEDVTVHKEFVKRALIEHEAFFLKKSKISMSARKFLLNFSLFPLFVN